MIPSRNDHTRDNELAAAVVVAAIAIAAVNSLSYDEPAACTQCFSSEVV